MRLDGGPDASNDGGDAPEDPVDRDAAGEDGDDGADDDGGDDGTVRDDATGGDGGAVAAADTDDESAAEAGATDGDGDVPPDVRKYERFKKMDGARYERVNEFLRDRTYITAREWAIARLCADFRTETGVEMTKIGENLPELVPFMTDSYTPQAVNQARYSFEQKVTKAGATFLYGAMSGFFTAEDLDEMMYEVTEVAKFLLEVEGVDLAVADELEAEDRISEVMREVRASSADIRGEEVRCPECGHVHDPSEE
ncbi:hypothetical protein GJ633_06585 [Halorubrum sp. CBA1125]|nr:hypothetical protein [Halorubrum sp. CBA1125]